ncbi:hypothetical protein SAMN04487773_0183 [Enterobacter sp. kpr-6]|nr:hypothetical protein SAMN04487773_0183 [Enterobacter sp. kpr-6]
MLHAVTGARSVGSEVRLGNQTSGASIGLTRWNVARLFIKIFSCDHRNEIYLAKLRPGALRRKGDNCFRSFLSVITVTYLISAQTRLEHISGGA